MPNKKHAWSSWNSLSKKDLTKPASLIGSTKSKFRNKRKLFFNSKSNFVMLKK